MPTPAELCCTIKERVPFVPNVSHMSFPLFAMKTADFLRQTKMVRFEQARNQGLIVEWTEDMGPLNFISHQWLGPIPDPEAVQLRTIQHVLSNLLTDHPEAVMSATDWETYSQTFIDVMDKMVRSAESSTSNDKDYATELRASLAAADDGKDANVRRFADSIASGYVWLDYHSVPQDNAKLQVQAIASLQEYVSRATNFFILAPTAVHCVSGHIASEATWRDRGWCRFERWCCELRTGGHFRRPLVVRGPHSVSVSNFSDVMTAESRSGPLVGRFTVEADRDYLAKLLPGIYDAKMRDLLDHNDLLHYRWLMFVRPHILLHSGSGGGGHHGDGDNASAEVSLQQPEGSMAVTANSEGTRQRHPMREHKDLAAQHLAATSLAVMVHRAYFSLRGLPRRLLHLSTPSVEELSLRPSAWRTRRADRPSTAAERASAKAGSAFASMRPSALARASALKRQNPPEAAALDTTLSNCGNGDVDLASFLARYGFAHESDISQPNPFFPLFCAAAEGNVPITKALLERGVDPSMWCPFHVNTALHGSAAIGGAATTALLLKAKATPHCASGKLGMTPLHRAAAIGDVKVCELLLDVGADPIAQRLDNGATPLHSAAANGHHLAYETLLRRAPEAARIVNHAGDTAEAMLVEKDDMSLTVYDELRRCEEELLRLSDAASRPLAHMVPLDPHVIALDEQSISSWLLARAAAVVDATNNHEQLVQSRASAKARSSELRNSRVSMGAGLARNSTYTSRGEEA